MSIFHPLPPKPEPKRLRFRDRRRVLRFSSWKGSGFLILGQGTEPQSSILSWTWVHRERGFQGERPSRQGTLSGRSRSRSYVESRQGVLVPCQSTTNVRHSLSTHRKVVPVKIVSPKVVQRTFTGDERQVEIDTWKGPVPDIEQVESQGSRVRSGRRALRDLLVYNVRSPHRTHTRTYPLVRDGRWSTPWTSSRRYDTQS